MKSGRPPVRIAHAYGNRREALRRALAAPIDMIEADIWFRTGRVWVRHERRLGPLPLLVDRRLPGHSADPYALPLWPGYYLRADTNPIALSELVETARGKCKLMLDVKGSYDEAGTDAFAATLARQVPGAGSQDLVILCGQNWSVLNRLRKLAPYLEVRYSIERPPQWEEFLRMIAVDSGARQVCIEHRFMTGEKARFLVENGIDIYCWTVDDPAKAERLMAAGVSGIISNSLPLLASLGASTTSASG